MKKLMMLAAVLAMMLVAVVPAMAQKKHHDRGHNHGSNTEISQPFEQESESGDAGLSFETSNTGDNSNVCAPALQFGNTGNLQNEQGVLQYDSSADDIEFEGSSMTFEPSLETECDQKVQQSSAASSGGSNPAGGSGPKPTKKKR